MLNIFIEMTILALMISIVAYVYSVILIEPDMLLGDFYGWMRRKIGHLTYLFKVLIHCDRCVSGQIALWFGVFTKITIGAHIYLIAASIFIPHLLQKLHRWTKKQS